MRTYRPGHGFTLKRGEYAERISNIGLHRMQATELYDDPQQAYADQPFGNEEILPERTEAHLAS